MKNQFEKIANPQVKLSSKCSELNIEILEKYWKFENQEFVYSPTQIKNKYKLSQSELMKMVKSYSKFSFYIFCANCNSYEPYSARSQSDFNNIVTFFSSRYESNSKCQECIKLNEEEKNEERAKENALLIEKFNLAIDNRNWKSLSNFEKGVLKNGVKMSFYELKKHYGNKLGQSQYYKFISALNNIENKDLFLLERRAKGNRIINHHYLDRLIDFIDEIIVEELEKPKQDYIFKKSTSNELKFKLTIDRERRHPDSPLYSGTVTFNEEIILKPNIEYAFAQWERTNNDLYLTIVPISEIKKTPRQREISELPISLREGIRRYFDN